MISTIQEILDKESFSRRDIISLLSIETDAERNLIFQKAATVREKFVGNTIALRGLIEYSNICSKNCLYCGIRAGNSLVNRYCLNEKEVLTSAKYAYDQNYGSVVIQSGERSDKQFIESIDKLIKGIKKLSNGELGITLSCGEQTEETYRRWFVSGAHRYLLRIESSNEELYYRIHPKDKNHDFNKRLLALDHLKSSGYQVGSGVMVGLPFQTDENLADDLLFLQKIDVDMVGMGPYIEHPETPLYDVRNEIPAPKERFEKTLLMIAILRIMMKSINIAASTAMDTLDKEGRIKAITAGANVLMPNITPVKYRENYLIYKDKPVVLEADELLDKFNSSPLLKNYKIVRGKWSDSLHFQNKRNVQL
jgi:biotin synthase